MRNPLSRPRLQLMSAYYDACEAQRAGEVPYQEVLIIRGAFKAVEAAHVALELSRRARGIVEELNFDVKNLALFRFREDRHSKAPVGAKLN